MKQTIFNVIVDNVIKHYFLIIDIASGRDHVLWTWPYSISAKAKMNYINYTWFVKITPQ